MRILLVIALINLPLAAQFSSFTIAATDPILQTTQGRVLDFPVPVRGGVAPYRFFIAGELTEPAGISLDASTGVLRISAPTVGYFRLEVCAADVSKATACAPYLVLVGARHEGSAGWRRVPVAGGVSDSGWKGVPRVSGHDGGIEAGLLQAGAV